jgi:hypothetical protein
MSIPVEHLPLDKWRHNVAMDMSRLYEVRRKRLKQAARDVLGTVWTQRELGDLFGRDANYISRILSAPNKSGHKQIGEELARSFEEKLGKPYYWLDDAQEAFAADIQIGLPPKKEPSIATVIDAEIVRDIVSEIRQEWHPFPDDQELGELIAEGYARVMLNIREEDRTRVKRIVQQVKKPYQGGKRHDERKDEGQKRDG